MANEDVKPAALFLRSQELKFSGQLDAYYDLMAEDVVIEDGFTHTKQNGRKTVQATTMAAISKYNLRWGAIGDPVIYQTTDPEIIIAEYDMYMTAAIDGQDRRLEVRDVLIMCVRHGKFVWIRAYSNAQQQLAATRAA